MPKNGSGAVLNPCFYPTELSQILNQVVNAYRHNLNTTLHSVWLRGSAARGHFTNLSDLDTFALIYPQGVRWTKASWTPKLEEALFSSLGFKNTLECYLSSFSSELPQIYPALSMMIKCQSLCLWGENIQNTLPVYKLDKDFSLNFKWLKTDLKAFQALPSPGAGEIRSICKLFLRSGFELVLPRIQTYTPDLYWCLHVFKLYYPQQKQNMQKVLTFFLNPPKDGRSIKPFILDFGDWLIFESQTQAEIWETL